MPQTYKKGTVPFYEGLTLRKRGLSVDRRGVESTLGRMSPLEDKLVDKRIIERNIAKGLISKEQYEKHLAELADKEGAYERVEIDPGESKDAPPRE